MMETLKLAKIRIISYENKTFEEIMERVFTSEVRFTPKKNAYFFKKYSVFLDGVIYGEAHKFKLNKLDIDLSDDMSKEEINRHNPLDATVRFAVFPDHSIVISSKQRFGSDMFIKTFDHVFRSVYPKYEAEASISYIRDDKDIFAIIDNFKRLVEVEIKGIKKSNPSPKPTYKKIEDFMKKQNTEVYSMKMVGYNEKGINRDHDGHVMSAISLSNGGYSDKCEFTGEEGTGGFRRINVNDLIMVKKVEQAPVDQPESFVKTALQAFIKRIRG